MKVVGFAGFSNSGKTTLITWIIHELKKRGVKVGVVKHTPHGFDVGKNDTGRFYKAGADFVVASSGKELLKIERGGNEKTLFEILNELKELEVVLVEGYKSAPIPWIVVFGKKITEVDVSLLDEREIIGLVVQDLNQIDVLEKHLKTAVVKRNGKGDIKIVRGDNSKEIPVVAFKDERIIAILKECD